MAANQADAILEATDELVREVIERNGLRIDDMVSCIFTCTEDLDAEFPAVAAREMGMSGVPLLCTREIPVPGSLPRVIRLLLHTYADESTRRQARVPARGRVAAARPGGGPVNPGIEFNRRLGDIPSYPQAGSYDFGGELVKLASNESPFGPPAAVVGAIQGRLETLNRYPDPDKTALRGALSDRTGVGRRVTVGNGSCEILLPAADALLEPGAELVYAWPSFSVYPMLASMSGATEIRCRWTRTATTTWTRWRARSPPPPGWCWSATPTTRPPRRCRWTGSPSSWPACPITSR